MDLLRSRLAAAGLTDVESVLAAERGAVAVAGVVRRGDGTQVFAKTLAGDGSDVFAVEAEGLRALRDQGGAATPAVVLVTPVLLVLEPLRPIPAGPAFWERLGRMIATLHTTTAGTRFGWHRDGWLGQLRQENAWRDDGHAFFAERRVLRWLAEPPVRAAFDDADRRALEHLCARLPELVPAQPPVLTHGDLWSGNVLADERGGPVLIDPATSYTWGEVDLSMLWCSPRPPEADRFFAVYEEIARPHDGWRDRMPLLHLRELLSVVGHGHDDWGAADEIRAIVKPFRRTLP
ncbi:fructosamine kinase family protein [Actinomycetes bacterium KLBMP 9797]